MLIDLDEAKKAMLKQQAIDLRDPALIGISFDGDLACEILDRLEPADRWIPVSERVPKADLIGEEFLVTVAEKDVGRTFVMTLVWEGADGGWNNGYGHTSEDVTAWMPLPEPYKEKKQ